MSNQGDQKISEKFAKILEKFAKILENFTKILEKVAKTVTKQKNPKISTSKLNLKVQNIYIIPLLNHWITYNKPCFEAAY